MAKVIILTEAYDVPAFRLSMAHQVLMKQLQKAGHEVTLHAYQTVDPFSLSFYDIMIFSYVTFMNTIPCEMMDFFTRLKQVRVLKARVYTLSFTDLYESDALLSSNEVIHMWCKRRQIDYCGGMIVTADFMLHHWRYRRQYKREAKKCAAFITQGESNVVIVAMASLSDFLTHGHQFWQKQITQRQKELSDQ